MNLKIGSRTPSKTKYGTIHRIDGLNKVTPIHVPLWENKLRDDPELTNYINKRALSDNIVNYLGEPLANKGDLVTQALLEYLVNNGIENIDIEDEDISPELQAALSEIRDSENDDHFGEEQAEGLDNLLAGLKDGPKDERW